MPMSQIAASTSQETALRADSGKKFAAEVGASTGRWSAPEPVHRTLPFPLARHRQVDRRGPVPPPCHLRRSAAAFALKPLRRLAEPPVPAPALEQPPKRVRVEHGLPAAAATGHDDELMPGRCLEERRRQPAAVPVVARHRQARRRRRVKATTLVGSGGSILPCRDMRGRGGCGSLGGRSGIQRTIGPAAPHAEHFRCCANPASRRSSPSRANRRRGHRPRRWRPSRSLGIRS